MNNFVTENNPAPDMGPVPPSEAATGAPALSVGRQARRDISRLGLALAAFVFLPQVIALLLYWLVPLVAPAWAESEWFFWGVQIFAMYVVGLCAFLLIAPTHTLPVPKREPVRFSFWWFVAFFCILMFCALAGSLISTVLSTVMSVFGVVAEDTTSEIIASSSPLWLFLVVVVIGPTVEEIVFRRGVLRVLLPFGERGAILLSGLIFGLIHGNIYQLFYACGIGILFAYLYARTGRLWHTILFHMIFNFFGGFLPAILTQALPLDELASGVSVEAMLAYLGPLMLLLLYELVYFGLAIAGLVLFIVRFRRAHFDATVYPLTAGERARAYFGSVGMILFYAVALILLFLSLL